MVVSHARAGACLALGGLIALFLACSSSDDGTTRQTLPPPDPANAEPLFRALQSQLVATCGGANGQCHVNGTYLNAPRWLANPDPYASAKKYRGILPATKEVGDSIILTQVQHEGPSLQSVPAVGDQPTLFQQVSNWLQAEVPPPPLPNTGNFSVADGFNIVPLDNVGDGLAGGKLSFLATESNGVLTLNALKVTAPHDSNVTITSPFFVIHPHSGKVDAEPDVNGFQGELTVPAGTSADLFTGKMVLLRWDPSGQLKIAFAAIATSPGQGVSQSCTSLDTFKSAALAAMAMPVEIIDPGEGDGGVGGGDAGAVVGQGSCLGCHGDSSPDPAYPVAINAMDLRGTDSDPGPACASARNWINFQNKPMSTILLNPTGQANPNHPMKALSPTDPIVTGIQSWVEAETQ